MHQIVHGTRHTSHFRFILAPILATFIPFSFAPARIAGFPLLQGLRPRGKHRGVDSASYLSQREPALACLTKHANLDCHNANAFSDTLCICSLLSTELQAAAAQEIYNPKFTLFRFVLQQLIVLTLLSNLGMGNLSSSSQ